MNDSIKKSIFKTITWRIVALLITSTIVFLYTKDLTFSASVATLDLMIKAIAYFVHERCWNRI
jgi:uncharacterized membrane protein